MAIDNYTLHQLHGFEPGCEWCMHERRPQRKKLKFDEMGEKFRKIANNLEKLGEWVKCLDKAKKSNKKGLIF